MDKQAIVDSFLSELPLPRRIGVYKVDGRTVFDVRGPSGGVTTKQVVYLMRHYSFGIELPSDATDGEIRERLSKGLKEFQDKLNSASIDEILEGSKFLDDESLYS